MLVYRSDERVCDPAEVLRRLARQVTTALSGASHDDVRDVLIEFGEFEAAVADGLFPRRDGLHPVSRTLRDGALSTGHALIASHKREPARTRAALETVRRRLQSIDPDQLPRTLPIRVSEGYAYYALYPETYAVAAERFVRERSPIAAVCLGIRSIGTSLSAVVAASLERHGIPVSLHTVRPHGHPFSRRIAFADDLCDELRAQPAHSHFLVVDEGPGLSGSSFAAVVRALTDLGIDAEHISMFPSWEADVSALRSEEARRVWSHHRSYTADAREAGFSLEQILAVASSEYIDLSAGAWRVHLLADERAWPAVQPQHEVRKAWIPTRGSIVRFAGFARYGAAKRHRADRIAGAGFGPDPEWLEGGYLSTAFVDGTPCTRATPALLDRIADHVAFLVRAFPAGRSPDVPQLEEMIRTNIRIGLGENVHLPDLAGFRGPLANAPCAGIDGRMLPHEWIGAGGRYTKVDALDHHADHFYPGIQDAGWDLAATAFEFRLDHGGLGHLVSRYEAASGDGDIRARLPFYDLAYPAFRLGYATLARGSVDAREAGRFDGVITRCRARLRALAGITLPSAP